MWHEIMPHRLLDECVAAKPVSACIEVHGWTQQYETRVAHGEDNRVYVLAGSRTTLEVLTKAVLMAYVLAFALDTPASKEDGASLDEGAAAVARVLMRHGEGPLRFWRAAFEEARAAFLRHLAGEAGHVAYVCGPTSATQSPKTPAPFVAGTVDEFRETLASSERRPWMKGKAGDA